MNILSLEKTRSSAEAAGVNRPHSSLCEAHQYTYGYRKITAVLRKEMKMNYKTVQRIMQTMVCSVV
ncbi:hypothetical protein CTV99_16920 [Bacillus pumilus]|uniref:HTH-like domain-containing protein n=1 Tax=Bacillus pumilus TaxID=1408 RepID=A0A2G8IPW7_BACPU|nr:hypothetical protein CTV99_16920 [Bacillus pumilus]